MHYIPFIIFTILVSVQFSDIKYVPMLCYFSIILNGFNWPELIRAMRSASSGPIRFMGLVMLRISVIPFTPGACH